ncbi:MAG: hypothetical protein II027_03145 [Bacteroidales bacterium]|nr:hypothetical protein [Bacteroidales bacterium]
MAFNPKYSSIPFVSDNIGMPDLPYVFPSGENIEQSCQGDTATEIVTIGKGGRNYPPIIMRSQPYFSVYTDADTIGIRVKIAGNWCRSLFFTVEPSIFEKKDWCKVTAYDTTRYNYSAYPIVVFFKAFQRKIEQQNVVVKYDDEVGTIIPLSQKQFDVLSFTTQPMNSDYARLLLDIAEWDNVTFQHWDTKNNAWSTAVNVAKKAESWQKTTYPKTLGTTIQGTFIIKQ